VLIRTWHELVFLGSEENASRAPEEQTEEATMSSLNEQMGKHGFGRGYGRWIAIAVAFAVVALGVVLLALYGGGGGSAPGY
jgi:hypothetical protein